MNAHLTIAAWEFKPAVSAWYIVPAILAALASVIISYRAHARIAARSTIRVLTGMRVALVIIVVGLLLAPTRVATVVRQTRGTLWVVLDDSGSMRRVDAQ